MVSQREWKAEDFDTEHMRKLVAGDGTEERPKLPSEQSCRQDQPHIEGAMACAYEAKGCRERRMQ